ncbi:bifunctional folylpolyglutamate synthase/dihydrofolate synthase [Campylobacter lari]|uniref:Bifunctional folylpolyglutamate synthase/dihydrofolate synthase n=1 Tax=Campylobacter lari TaxID=201 RepID=A0A6N6BAH8_CAMLA|nr:Mur ligase family protein [Campylobacter lari]EAH7030093.1 bifunctional folylpolyglutamate synthase/dihydrofolate synthase [Campylobacter lari]EAH8850275.1 bifunctional folylpolyglutamate synthase/dihydrofolate synthase [Campylobacter lari]EAI4435429.1 bifunctional folylpolyglutamate synthase/dihydrofolate synthase [Campylobacter lari]EAI7247156.1 bifunctional folylpolyglutamate synthase/dihydrofolate synthase [Campylobacter lari]EAJ0338507.1 bifunctional folylpolyglutamate synthase/dihydro
MKFQQTLSQKTMHVQKISRFFMFSMYEKYKKSIPKTKNIQIIGTNGKGSTGRFLALLLLEQGYKVGHYTSPHIFDFNERFWLNGKITSNELLEKAHEELESVFLDDVKKLSYFEYATFLAFFVFKDCDYVVLEAGVGGEYDATSVFEIDFSIFTKIGFDHQDLLGKNLDEIARTKLKAMSTKALINHKQEVKVLNLAQKIANLKQASLNISSLDKNTIIYPCVQEYIQKYNLASFLKDNLFLALEAFSKICAKNEKELIQRISNLPKLDLKGRCEQISQNIFVDVGHNEMAALTLAEIFKEKKVHLVYNCFLDKDSYKILRALKPIIKIVEIYEYESKDRPLAGSVLLENLEKLDIAHQKFEQIKKDKLYLVFGSFVLVENFLRGYNER